MKRVDSSIIILLFAMLSAFGCSDNDECSSGSLDILDLEDFGCSNPPFNITVATLNEFELIRNQEDYDFHVTGRCAPQINWQEYDLIAGTALLPKGLDSIDKSLIMDCSNNTLKLTFRIKLNLTQVAPSITFNAIIPKLKNEQDFFVEVLMIE